MMDVGRILAGFCKEFGNVLEGPWILDGFGKDFESTLDCDV